MDDIPPLRRLVDENPLVRRLVDTCPDTDASLVGGVVRDALLGRPSTGDVDIVVEGDAIPVARRVAEGADVRVTAHERFGTAVVSAGDRHIDLVSARRETYPRPGAPPVVAPGTITDDLARRDFTINAIAYRLTGPSAGDLLDPFGGCRDLTDRRVRVLHPASFIDDPSRLIRAVRYAARLGFALEEETARLATAAAPEVTSASARVLRELRRLLDEPSAAAALDRARDLGVDWIRPDVDRAGLFRAIDIAAGLPDAPPTRTWALRLGAAVAEEERRRAALDARTRADADGADRAPGLVLRLRSARRPSEIDGLLRAAPSGQQVVALARGAGVIADWWATMRDMELLVTGDDIVRMGVPAGPRIGTVLADLRAAVLDGALARDDLSAQRAFVSERV